MTYCYARVSTREQKLDRQLAEFKPFEPYELYCDKESGKNFDRKQYLSKFFPLSLSQYNS